MKSVGGARFGLAVVVLLLARVALAYSPVPEFPSDGTVAVQDVPDSFGKLRRFLEEHRSPVGAKYHVAVVAFSDPQDREGPDYGDESGAYINRVVEAWRPRVDTENTVIILLALRNRDIIVHPFSKWARLGWEQQAVVDTIDGSPFASFARAGDYEAAIQALIGAIDDELGRRLKALGEQARQAGELLALTRARNTGFPELVQRQAYDPPDARQRHERAVSAVESAERALAAGEIHKGFKLAREAADEAAEAERLVLALKAAGIRGRNRWQSLGERARALEQSLASAEFDVGKAQAQLGTARTELDSALTLLEAREPEEAQIPLSTAEVQLSLAGQGYEHARWAHEFKTRTLPRLIAGLVGLVLLGWLYSLYSRSARRRREAEALIAEWQTLLARAADNLLKLEDEHALILGRADLVERFDGESAGPIRKVARAVDDVFVSYEAAQRLLTEVREALSRSNALWVLREQPYERAIERLTIDEVVVRTEDVTERKLFLPDRREVRMKPPRLLSEMQADWERALRLVEELEAGFRQAWEEMDRLKVELGVLESLEARLVELDAPSPLRGETVGLVQRLTALHERSRRDPLGAAAEAKSLAVALSMFLARTERLVEAVSRLRDEVHPRREEGSELLVRLRSEGLFVAEPGFEPEAMLAHIDRATAAAQEAIRTGHDEKAVAAAKEAADSVAELLELCERTRRSREQSASRITEAAERGRTLLERLPERRERLQALRRLHADPALRPALDNTEEAAGVLEQATRCLTEARACVAPDVQRYLAGAELIDRAVQLLEAVEALYQEIETKADALAHARRQAESALAQAERSFAELQAMIESDEAFASGELLETRGRLGEELPEARKAGSAERPDWPELREGAQVLASAVHSLLERARSEKDAWRQALQLSRELSTRREAYGETLRKRTDDREATNARFQEVSAELDATLELARRPRISWPQVLESLRRAAEGLEVVNRMAEADFAAAASARGALAKAGEVMQAANTYYGHGVQADLSDAREAFRVASRFLAERNYAEANRMAEEARQKARKASSDARSRAETLEAQERKRRARSSYSSSSSSRGSSFSSSSSRSSSSFGSSSGRSSFGSSSGRSSFSSSSGRSKW